MDETYSKRGIIVYIKVLNRENHDPLFMINVYIRNWNIYKSQIRYYNSAYRNYPVFITTKQNMEIYNTEIEDFLMDESSATAGFFTAWNLARLNNIKI